MAEIVGGDEIRDRRPADDARERGRGQGSAHGLVQSMRSPQRARPGRTGSLVWAGDDCPRLARSACLLAVWEPRRRYGGQWDEGQ